MKEIVNLVKNDKKKIVTATRIIEEDLTPEQIIQIHNQLSDGVKAKELELTDFDKISEAKKANLQNEVKELNIRLKEFDKHLKQAKAWAAVNKAEADRKKQPERNEAVRTE